MIYVIYGALGAIYTLGLLILGAVAGYRTHAFLAAHGAAGEGGERIAAERSVFDELLRYDPYRAYGGEERSEAQ